MEYQLTSSKGERKQADNEDADRETFHACSSNIIDFISSANCFQS